MTFGFEVDTHLLRELGDLLVGRDSTAILELVKNGYDADATVVVIDAQNLADPATAILTVSDDGNGMTVDRFQSAFLRIAGRDKEGTDRRSARFRRSFTGQKGIGRLASQKLATRIRISSQPRPELTKPGDQAVAAEIDWALIDQQFTLNELEEGLEVRGVPLGATEPGTTMQLTGLKRKWSRTEIANFVNELRSAQPPRLVLGSHRKDLGIAGDPLFEAPVVRRTDPSDPGFRLEFSGDLESGDDLWTMATKDFTWCVEIEARHGVVRYQITPTRWYQESEPVARPYEFEAVIDREMEFQARFFILPGASASRGPLSGFVRANSGIRVYMEGFRVLPYGEYGDDWLSLDREYRGGPRYYTLALNEARSDHVESDKNEALLNLPNAGYYGAVFLTHAGSPGLQSLVNREGFVPNDALRSIVDSVQTGVRLSVRVRRSIHLLKDSVEIEPASGGPPEVEPVPVDQAASEQDREALPTPVPFELLRPQTTPQQTREAIESAKAALAAEAGLPSSGEAPRSRAFVDGFIAASSALQSLESIQPELRTLAGVGLQMGAFVHDINGMLDVAANVRRLLANLMETATAVDQRRQIRVIQNGLDELAHTLARQSSYLTDVLATDPRRRRSRLIVLDRVESALRFLRGRIADSGAGVAIDIDPTLKTPPMFPAEFTIAVTNLLTNAVKNCGVGGQISVAAAALDDGVEVTVANTGNAVDLVEAERWFLPFESTTTTVDEVLGQGLGLGLPIVRAIANDYNGDVHFVVPNSGYATSVRLRLRER